MNSPVVVRVEIDGKSVWNTWRSRIISLKINLTDGGKSDTLEAEFDDAGGVLVLPAEGAKIKASIGSVRFEGETDEPESSGSRGGGMTLSISAKSASAKGKVKQKVTKSKDSATFEAAATDFANVSGLKLKIAPELAKIQRPYWSIANQSFAAWAAQIATDLGATFKIMGQNAVFVPRNSGTSASGKALVTLEAKRPGNVISWQMTPTSGRAAYKESRQRWYDPKEAKWKTQTVQIADSTSEAVLTETATGATADRAKSKAKANAEEAKRARGGGTLVLDGNSSAQPQAFVVVSGIRAGIDGQYQIKTASHSVDRSAMWTVSIKVEQPQGSAGKDKRAKK